jgi:hypothetical protein
MAQNPYKAPYGTGYSLPELPRKRRAVRIVVWVIAVVLALLILEATYVRYLKWKSESAPVSK